MPVLVVIIELVAASSLYAYRLRAEARYERFIENLRRGLASLSPPIFAMYMTTLAPRRSSPARALCNLVDSARIPIRS